MLIVDGADAVAEGMGDAFRYLVDAAIGSDVKVIAITAVDSMQVVRNTLTDRFGAGVAKYALKPLTDTELDDIVTTFAELERLNANPRSRELLRLLVVVDLLVRGQVTRVTFSDANAMREVKSGLVSRHELPERGSPCGRESMLLRLADLALSGIDRLSVISELDPTALAGLRHDGLLRTSLEDPFIIGAEFAHDAVRRYAVARLLLADRAPASRIMRDDAPRLGPRGRTTSAVAGVRRAHFGVAGQFRVGLPWVSTLVLASPSQIAKGSFMLADWLIETRSAAASADLSALWQQVVDALVVEGFTRLAPYSE